MVRPSLLILPGVLLLALPLSAAGGKAAKYPLHVQIRRADYGCTNCDSPSGPPEDLGSYPGASPGEVVTANPNLVTIDPDRHFAGSGRGVLLLDGKKKQTFFFAYASCADPLPLSGTVSLAARWKKPGEELEVLVPYYSPKKPINYATKKLSKCEVDFSLTRIPITRRSDGPIHLVE